MHSCNKNYLVTLSVWRCNLVDSHFRKMITKSILSQSSHHVPINRCRKVYTLYFQIILPGGWIFAIIFNCPQFLVKDITKIKGRNLCLLLWSKEWMGVAYSMAWFAVVVISLALMALLYSRVVYTLWFKRNDDSQLTHQQKVSVPQITILSN